MGGGWSFTNALERELDRGFEDAEQYKQHTMLLDDSGIPGALAARERADALVVEVQQVLEYFRNRTRETIGRLCLVGGGAQLKGLPAYLQDALHMAVQAEGEWLTDLGGSGEDTLWTDAVGTLLREEAGQ